jgi:hypothetical protein
VKRAISGVTAWRAVTVAMPVQSGNGRTTASGEIAIAFVTSS